MTKHHKYGGSTSGRWLNCPGSTQLIEKLKAEGKIPKVGPSNIYSETGTVAHALGEICLDLGFDVNDFYGKTIPQFIGKKQTKKYLNQKELSFINIENEIINEEYVEAVTVYINYCREHVFEDSIFFIEGKFELIKYVKADCGGSADFAIIQITAKKLHIIDYKNGKGLVEVDGNTQFYLYALGAYRKYKDKYDIEEVEITVVQPRAPHQDGPIRSEHFTVKDLITWGRKVLKPGIKLCESKNPPIIAGDVQCHWCEASGHCKENANHSLSIAQSDFDTVADTTAKLPAPQTLTIDEVQIILNNKSKIENWLKSVYNHAQNALESGESIKGYKLVERLSNRKYGKKERKLIRALIRKNILDIFEQPKLRSPAQLEKHLGIVTDWAKAEIIKFVNKFTERTINGVSMASTNDGREEIAPSIETDFADVAEKPKKRKTRKNRRTRK